jgi:hypothetical protein
MRNVHEVLRQKETELERVRMEVEALRRVAPLLADEPEKDQPTLTAESPWPRLSQNNRWPLRVDEPPTYLSS